MNATLKAARGTFRASLQFFGWILLALLLTLSPARADGPDDDYLTISGMIDNADALNASGKTVAAHAKYLQIEQILLAFQKDNPSWDPATIKIRLHQLNEKIAESSAPTTDEPTLTAPPVHVAKPVKSPAILLSNGSEPRIALKFKPTLGDKHDVTMTLNIGMSMAADGKTMPLMNIPAITMAMSTTITKISPEGDITYSLVMGNATVASDATNAPALAGVMKATLAKMSGISGIGKMTDHGVVKNVDLKFAGSPDPQTAQILSQMKESMNTASFVLPDAPVGPGARWQYKTHAKSQGIALDQTLTTELVSVDGDRITLNTTMVQTAPSQKIQNPAMPGFKMDLIKLTGTGTGKSTLDLSQTTPISASLDEDMEIVMGLNLGQKQQSMDMKMKMGIVFTSN